VKHGSDVNAVDNSQQTALHWAAVRGAIAVADVLLQNGARVEAADLNGYRVIFDYIVGFDSGCSLNNGIFYRKLFKTVVFLLHKKGMEFFFEREVKRNGIVMK